MPSTKESVAQTAYRLKLSEAEFTRYRLMAEGAARAERGWWTTVH